MPDTSPLVSIGLPVYNGDDYLAEALESLVKQTYPNLEIIISDNGSTDNTQKMCEEYAEKYPFVIYHRYDENRGVAWNRNNAFLLTKGEYFLWFSHDDVLHPSYVEKCVQELLTRTDTCIAYSKIDVIDDKGNIIPFDESTIKDLDTDNIVERFRHCLRPQPYNQSTIYGVMKKSTLSATPLHGDYIAADRCLVAQLSLLGKMYRIPEALFFRRKHINNIHSGIADLKSYQPGAKVEFVYPEWNVLKEHIKTVHNFDIDVSTKKQLYKEVVNYFIERHEGFRYELTSNLKKVFKLILNSKQ